MPSELKKRLTIRYKRFKRWTDSEEFQLWMFKFMAIFIAGLMVLSILVGIVDKLF